MNLDDDDFDLDADEPNPSIDSKIAKEIKQGIKLIKNLGNKTNLIVIAVHSDSEKNRLLHFATSRAFSPIGGNIYDANKDQSCFFGIDFVELGLLNFAFKAIVEDTLWEVSVPMSVKFIKKNLSESQRSSLAEFIDKHKDDKVQFLFLQFLY